ncbi:MAG: YybS family protein [Synergistaceae bacterium]|jgi:uncharacterized protein YybS (DUF2232 family)|nr:YybS family protein [Synergistaceae bacterium]
MGFLLFTIGLLAPALALPLMLIYPFPFASLYYERGILPALVSALTASAALVLFIPPFFSLIYFIVFGLSGILIGLSARKILAAAELLPVAVIAALTAKLLSAFIVFRISGVNLMAPDASELERTLLPLVESGALNLSGVDVEHMRAEIPNIINYLIMLIPFSMILFSTVEVLVSLYIVSFVHSRRTGEVFFSLPPFGSWSFPRNILLAFAAGFICANISDGESYYILRQVGLNLNALTRTFFILQGLSMGYYFMERRGFSKILRAVIIILTPLISVLGDVYATFGLLDIIFNFRKRVRGLGK